MCFPNCTKYLLVILNIAVFLAGATIFVAGLLLLLETGLLHSDVITLLNYIKYGSVKMGLLLQVICYMMVASGVIIMAIAVVGICGAWKKIKCCLLVFVFFVIFGILVQAAIVGLWINLSGRSDQWLEGKMESYLTLYRGPTETDHISNGYNKLFMKARCCGVTHWSDFNSSSSAWHVGNTDSEQVPASCCQGVDSDDDILINLVSNCTVEPRDYYTDGCYDVIVDKVDTYLLIMCLVGGIGLCVEVATIVLSCMVLDQTKNRIRSGPGDSVARPPPYIGIDSVLKNNKKTIKRI